MKLLLLVFILMLTGCILDPEYDVTYEDLLGKHFIILNECAHNDYSMLTTDVYFNNNRGFTILEKLWKVDNGKITWLTTPDGDTVTQRYIGKISDISGGEWQVLTLNIRRLNMNGAEVTTGYKDVALYKTKYNGLECYAMADVGWQTLGGGGEWVIKNNGSTSYFYHE